MIQVRGEILDNDIKKKLRLRLDIKENILQEEQRSRKSTFRQNKRFYCDQRLGYIELLKTMNTRYHLTIQFSHGTSEENAIRILSTFIRNLNKRVYKDRYRSGKNFIKGFAVKESTKSKLTCHFHLLLMDNDYYPNKELLEKWIEKQKGYFIKCDNKNYITSHLLQSYQNLGDDNLEHYLTKNFESLSNEEAAMSIAPFSENGVEFGSF